MALRVVDRAIQAHGAEGISQDTPLAKMWAGLRTLRFADGPDEVHLQQQGKFEIKDRLEYVQARHESVRTAEMRLGVRRHKL
jgi:acyl-CoA dehydrogenase